MGDELMSEHAGDELRGSAPVMSAKDLLLEVYKDMKFVRPALEGLLAAGLIARVEGLELEFERRKAAGLKEDLVHRVELLEDEHLQKAARVLERRRIGDISARTLAALILVSNFVLGVVVFLVNVFNP